MTPLAAVEGIHAMFTLMAEDSEYPCRDSDCDEGLFFKSVVEMPSVGDTISYMSGGKPVGRKVISRHIFYGTKDEFFEIEYVQFVVVAQTDHEMAKRCPKW